MALIAKINLMISLWNSKRIAKEAILFKQTSVLDGMFAQLLKKSAPVLTPVLTKSFLLSYDTGFCHDY